MSEWLTKKELDKLCSILKMANQVCLISRIYSGACALASQGAPLLRKFGFKSIDPRNFGCDVSVRPSVQTLGEGERSAVLLGNRRFFWREIA